MHVQEIFLYPLKSAAALAPSSAQVAPRGLDGDRRWLVVDAEGVFQTGRQLPALVRIRATAVAEGLRLAAPGQPDRSGAADPEGEPLRTLKDYRRSAAGITFGMHLIARGTGAIAVGDPVTALA